MYPNLIVSLHSPIVFNIKQTGAKYIKFFVFDSEERLLATLEKQARNFEASFDVSYILQNSMKDVQNLLPLRDERQRPVQQTTRVFEDDRNCIKFKVGWQIDNEQKHYHNRVFFAVNSKHFNQEQEYLTSDTYNTTPSKILSLGSFIKYEGYPLTITCQSGLGNADSLPSTSYATQRGIRIVGTASSLTKAKYLAHTNGKITSFGSGIVVVGRNENVLYEGVFNVEIDRQDGNTFTLNSIGGNITREIKQTSCEVKHPYYVKWTNLAGGWQYFMFDFHQTLQHKKQEQEIVKGFKENSFELKRTAIGTQYERILTIGAENLSKEQFNNIYSLLYSDFVFHYDEPTQKWERIFIDNQSLTHSTNGRSFEVEFSVIL